MASVHDVAAYILHKRGSMSTMKLQKLVYYSQAWSLAWDERPLFPEDIQAWANGPVVYELFDHHRGRFEVGTWPAGDHRKLGDDERETIDAVLRQYGRLSGRKLSHLTHSEGPWRDARKGLGPSDPSSAVINKSVMQEFYGALDTDDDAVEVDEVVWKDD
jgi:uncharacterized phage-associated protein